jgi:hypothetical protein
MICAVGDRSADHRAQFAPDRVGIARLQHLIP